MGEPKTIYAVTTGAYSDYCIEALYESREDAQQMVEDKRGWGPSYEHVNDVEEFTLYPSGCEIHTVYTAEGFVGAMEVVVHERLSHEPGPQRPKVDVQQHWGPRPDERRYRRIVAVCRDRDRAIKSVKDRLAAAKATQYEPELAREAVELAREAEAG